MIPPVCALCRRPFAPDIYGGSTVRFADYEPLPALMVGMPRGLHWFCADHLQQALQYGDLPFRDALAKMQGEP